MKAKKICVVTCITVLSLIIFTGCDRSSQTTDVEQLAEWARQEGYHQAYIEMAYAMNMVNIPDEDYTAYLQAKQQYEENTNMDNLRILFNATQKVLQDMPASE